MSAIATNLHGKWIPEVWAKLLVANYHPQLFLNYITNNKYEGEIKDKGDIVKIRNTPTVTVNDYTNRTDLSVEEFTPGAPLELAIDKAKYYMFDVEDIEKHQADIDYVQAALSEAGKKIKETIEEGVVNSVYASVATYNKGASAGAKSNAYNLGNETAGTSLTLTKDNVVDFIINCGSCLDEYNVPENDRFVILPPIIANLLKKSDLRQVYITGDAKSSLRTGNIGMIDRFNIFVSNSFTPVAPEESSSASTSEERAIKWRPLFGQKDAITFASQLVKNEVVTREKRFGKIQRGLSVYGYKVVKPEALGYGYVRV